MVLTYPRQRELLNQEMLVSLNMRFELTGNWSLEADQIRHGDIEMSSSSDDTMGSMVSKMINGKKGIAGEGNIYELSANRMVIMGSDGRAMEYVRQ